MRLSLIVYLLIGLVILQSCGDAKKENKNAKTAVNKPHGNVPDATSNLTIIDKNDIVGYWVGNFYGTFEGKVNITIDKITSNKVSGYTVIGGILKPFLSTMEVNGSTYNLTAERPGTGKYDGTLKFDISRGDSVLRCTLLTQNGTRAEESVHGFKKKLFHYDPNSKLDEGRYVDYNKEKNVIYHDADEGDIDAAAYLMATRDVNKFNSSVDLLTKEDVANMKKPDIIVLRNSIFARHGYAFKKGALWAYFSEQGWYVPMSTDVTADLNATEKKNIELLMRYEKNAKDNYDSFGR